MRLLLDLLMLLQRQPRIPLRLPVVVRPRVARAAMHRSRHSLMRNEPHPQSLLVTRLPPHRLLLLTLRRLGRQRRQIPGNGAAPLAASGATWRGCGTSAVAYSLYYSSSSSGGALGCDATWRTWAS